MISVCLPTYNGEKYIATQLNSILAQLGPEDEVIVSDDSSTDKTLEIIQSIGDKRVKIFSNNQFHSPIFNLENALKKSSGDIIFLSDQDDVWLDGKVKKCKELLSVYDCIVSDAKVVDSELNVIFESFFEINKSRKGFWRNLYKNGFLGCCMCINRQVLEKALPFPKNIAMHDIWIGLVAEKFFTSFFLKEPLILYRRHGNNVSSTSEKSKNTIFNKLMYRLDFLVNLSKLK